jgi:hypothetical protein
MKRLLLLLAFASPAFGQTVITGNRLGWDQAASVLTEAQGFTYRYYPDAASTGTTLSGVTCAGATSPFQCSAPFPAFTPGAHVVMLTAANIAGESVKSQSMQFIFVVVPGAPANLRIQ